MQVSESQINFMHENGFVVIENVLKPDLVKAIREMFHRDLSRLSIDHHAILSRECPAPAEAGLKSDVSNLFYPQWKMQAHLHLNVISVMEQLLLATFLSPELRAQYPIPSPLLSSDIYAYLDRVAYRLPNHIRNEKGLDLHMDRHPTKPFEKLKKWRPIQAFIALTDHFGGQTGGLRVVPGFHKICDSYFARSTRPITEAPGEFYRMTDHSYDRLRDKLLTVQAPAGSLVCWDNRLPHATCSTLSGSDSREVIYVGFLPDIELNRDYIHRQWMNLCQNLSPPAYDSIPTIPRDWTTESLTRSEKQMLGIK